MEKSLFRYIWRYSKRDQFVLLAVTGISFPFLYYSLDLPKTIVNKAIGGTDFPKEIALFDFHTGIFLDHYPYLWMLCGIFLALVFINGGFKYRINVLTGVLAERMLRRVRYHLIKHVLRFPMPHFRNASSGSIVTMIAAETEPLGGFIGDAFSLPAFQGGTLLTILVFMFIQDWKLGLAAVALYPVQAYVIPKLQRKVNLLGKARVRNVRDFSEKLGETIAGVGDIHSHGTAPYELARFTDNMATTYNIRYEIYEKKFFIKFLNNFLGQLTPFFFFSIGGYLVIEGSLTLGALVAILSAYKEVSAPWKELLVYYQRLEDARQKYTQLVEQFTPPGLLDERTIDVPNDGERISEGKLTASNLSLEEDGSKVIAGASFAAGLDEHVALSGPDGGGRTEVARILARHIVPTGGQISIGGHDLVQLPEVIAGRSLAYVDGESYIRTGSIRDNLLYGLMHQPTRSTLTERDASIRKARIREGAMAGNSGFDIRDDWTDYEALGIEDAGQITGILTEALRAVTFEDDIFQIGLRRVIDPAAYPELVAGVLAARARIRKRLEERPELAELVEIFDKEKFNANASVAENILFGTPLDHTFNIDHLAGNAFVLKVLGEVGLRDRFPELGRAIAALMIELFRDLPPGHEFFERFSFIDAESLPEYQRILNHVAANGLDSLGEVDRALLTELPFRLIPARHRLGLLTDEIEAKILQARRLFAATLPDGMTGCIAFFDAERYNAAISLQDNILFGKIATHKAESVARIGDMLSETIEALSLRGTLLEVGLDFNVGIAGKRLTTAQRQKLAIARCLVKKPQLLVVNEATQGLNAQAQEAVFNGIKAYMQGRGLIWVQGEVDPGHHFDRIIRMERGRAIEVSGVSAEQHAAPQPEAESEVAEGGMAALAARTEVLASIPFFSGMDRSQLKLLAFASEQHDYSPGEDIIRQGASGDTAYVILDGTIDVVVDTTHGPTTVATVGRGALLGELALLCDTPRTATVRAKGAVTAMVITKELFFELIHENAAVALNLTRMIADRLAKTMRGISSS